MDPEREQITTDYIGQTTLHPLGFAAVVMLGLAMLVLPRRYAVWPLIIMACFISPAQRLVIASLNFDLLRVMVLFGTARILTRSEWRSFLWRPADWLVLAWAISGTLSYVLLYGSAEALKFKLGSSYDAIGMYFLFRMLVRNWEDVRQVILGFTFVGVPVAGAFIVEWMTGRNMFAVFGGVREVTWVRDGRLRCQGAFAHAILAGCFWAAVLPLVVAQWWQGRGGRRLAVAGGTAALLIVFACASATPISAVILGAVGAFCFVVRTRMRWVQWGTLLLAVALHLLMEAPVWHLISRVDIVGGSTGWHRFHLIDEAIIRVGEWWLFGVTSTAHWGRGLSDVTNQYVLEGVRGGLLTLILFLAIITVSFRRIGILRRSAKDDRPKQILVWALGVSLFVHITSFIAVSYFGQINMLWYLSLAMITSLTPMSDRKTTDKVAVIRTATPHERSAGVQAGLKQRPVPLGPQAVCIR